MVEVQGRHRPARSPPTKKGRGVADDHLWRCGWRCFACATAFLGCCGGGCSGGGGRGRPGTDSGRSAKERTLLWLGGVALLLGILLASFWTQLLTLVVHSELTLTPRSTSYRVWQNTPVPLKLDFYFWNWTNPHEINDPDAVPHFEQMGPYRFRETKEKVNITWNENNGTISFRQLRRWYFDAEYSNGTLADNVTTINVVALTAAHVVRDWMFIMRRSVELALRSTNQDIAITRTAGQFLFEGYDDPLITIASSVPALAGVSIPNFDKFGWFYTRNGSVEYDGLLNMDTGAGNIGHLGELKQWNYNNFTPFYEGSCGDLRGSAGELWPPGRSTADRVSLFAPDLCRSVSLDYAGQMREAGVDGLRFEGGPLMLDNGQLDPDNACFCGGGGGECVAAGVANVSACRYGAPAFVSFPHFHLADPAYRAAVSGMRPSADRHSFYIALEPTYGIPLDVAARFQINLLVRRDPYISMLSKVPEQLMFPVMWFEQRAAITAELAAPLRLLLQLPLLLHVTAAVLLVGGVACVAAAVLLRRHRRGLRADTLALVASVVAKSSAAGAHGPTAFLPADAPDGAGLRRRSLLGSAPTGSPDGGAEQPLLPGGGRDPGDAGSGSGSGGTSSPVPCGAPAPLPPPEHSGTPEPPEPVGPAPARDGSPTSTPTLGDTKKAVTGEEGDEPFAGRVADEESTAVVPGAEGGPPPRPSGSGSEHHVNDDHA